MWGETHPTAAQGTLSSSGLEKKRGVIVASSISIKCSFQIKRKGGKKEEKGRDGCLLKNYPPH